METFIIIVGPASFIGGMCVYKLVQNIRYRIKMNREDTFPNQEDVSYNAAELERARLQNKLTDRLSDAIKADAIPDINKKTVEEAYEQRLIPYGEATWLSVLFRFLDVLNLKMLIVNREDFERAVELLKKAGITTLIAVLMFCVFPAQAMAHSMNKMITDGVERLRSFLI